MDIRQQIIGRNAITVTGFSSLASGDYCVSNAVVFTTNNPIGVAVEVRAGVGSAPAGSKQVVVFVKESWDGTTFRSGPESGSSTTDQDNLRRVGVVNLLSTGAKTETFMLEDALGKIPHSAKFVFKNEAGVVLNDGALFITEIKGVVV